MSDRIDETLSPAQVVAAGETAMPKIIQLCSDGDFLYAVGDDGHAYRYSYEDKSTGETSHDEYGSPYAVSRRMWFWMRLSETFRRLK